MVIRPQCDQCGTELGKTNIQMLELRFETQATKKNSFFQEYQIFEAGRQKFKEWERKFHGQPLLNFPFI